MESKFLLALVGGVVLASGCVSQNSTSTVQGDFELLVSDAPAAIDDFESLDVEFSEARVFKSNNSTNATKTIDLHNKSVDLTTVKGAKVQSLVNTTLESGNYSKVELGVSSANGTVNGSNVDVKVPPAKLMITKDFEIAPNKSTSFVFDIQVVLRGSSQNNQGYILKPVISESGVVSKDVRVERQKTGNTSESSPDSGSASNSSQRDRSSEAGRSDN